MLLVPGGSGGSASKIIVCEWRGSVVWPERVCASRESRDKLPALLAESVRCRTPDSYCNCCIRYGRRNYIPERFPNCRHKKVGRHNFRKCHKDRGTPADRC